MINAYKSYVEKLKDPRWQRKRLEVLNRFGWACDACGNSSEELHVHHRYYTKGFDPWEYPDDCYQALCKRCHEAETARDQTASKVLGLLPVRDRHRAIAFIAGLGRKNGLTVKDLPRFILDQQVAREYARARELSLEECFTEQAMEAIQQNLGVEG